MRLKLTDEQKHAIIASRDGRPMTINAVAGSGKTMTLRGIASASQEPGVYLVFNSAMRKEAVSQFPNHVIPMTGHSLAFRGVIAQSHNYENKFRAASNGRQIHPSRIAKVIDSMAMLPLTQRQATGMVLDTIKSFQHSEDRQLSANHVPMSALPRKLQANTDSATRAYLFEAAADNARRVWDKMVDENDDFPILHDTYLKIFQMRSPEINCPRWLCDEHQDANPVTNAIIRQQEGQKIYVGDRNQAIYGWRNAVNALENLEREPGIQSFSLSKSFRFGPEIAGLAGRLLKAVDRGNKIYGAGQPLTRPDPSQPKTVIARNNLTLLDYALTAGDQGLSFALTSNAGEMANMVKSAYALYRGNLDNISHKEIKGYESWNDFKEVAKILDDQDIARLVRVVESYKSRSTHLADQLLAQKDARPDLADLVLTTAHKAKGCEWNQVELADDLALPDKLITKLQNKAALSDHERESINILYVALTRPRQSLILPEDIQDNLKAIRFQPPAENMQAAMADQTQDEAHHSWGSPKN